MKSKKTITRTEDLSAFSSHGQRWKHQALLRIRNRTPAMKWRRFAETVKTTFNSQAARFDSINERVRLEDSTAAQELQLKTINAADRQGHPVPWWSLQKLTTPRDSEDAVRPASPDRSHEARYEMAREVKPPQPDMAGEIEHSSSFQPDSRIKAFLANLLNIRIPAVKIYANQASDAWTRRYQADAVTYDDKILFKAGHYDPTRPRGMALLGHELTHAAQNRLSVSRTTDDFPAPGSGKFPKTQQIDRNEEIQALVNERRVLQYFAEDPSIGRRVDPSPLSPATVRGSRFSPMPSSAVFIPPTLPATVVSHLVTHRRSESRPVVTQPPATPTGPLQTALSDRDLSPNPAMDTAAGMTASCELSPETLQMIKDMVYQDICDRIRLDFERGG